jgi:uncharacterized iron-regulated membrane protein
MKKINLLVASVLLYVNLANASAIVNHSDGKNKIDFNQNDPIEFTAGDTFIHWLHPLHSGEAFDMPGRFLVLLTGLSCPILFITGLMRWQQKRRAERLRAPGHERNRSAS